MCVRSNSLPGSIPLVHALFFLGQHPSNVRDLEFLHKLKARPPNLHVAINTQPRTKQHQVELELMNDTPPLPNLAAICHFPPPTMRGNEHLIHSRPRLPTVGHSRLTIASCPHRFSQIILDGVPGEGVPRDEIVPASQQGITLHRGSGLTPTGWDLVTAVTMLEPWRDALRKP